VRFSELEGARIGVWGAGREIASFAAQAARRLPRAEIAVAAFDEEPPADRVASLLGTSDVRTVAAAEAVAAFAGCDVVVRSPGVSIHRPELASLRRSGPPVTTPTSLWLAEREGRGVLGVTGTKGKSTTAALACHLARAARRPAELAGNIGRPALDLLDADPDALAVVELSSYQLADLAVGPEIAVVTNLYAEHADWHGSEQAYRDDKLRILTLPGVREVVLPARQPELAGAEAAAARRLFGAPPGWDAQPDGIVRDGVLRLPASALPLPGEHNALNLCAALAGLEAAGVGVVDLPAAVEGFRGLDHRLQTVAESDGLTWINDSISTTPESALAALASFPGRPLVLLGGGQDRGQDYAALAGELVRRGALLIGMPSTGERLLDAARAAGLPEPQALAAEDLAGAVALARRSAPPGSVVLLSPAAPSYDRFRDFEERGESFAALARGEAIQPGP
jgi:UDP-N-acetylmuramoyl-L-alanine---L-glutamate ligase